MVKKGKIINNIRYIKKQYPFENKCRYFEYYDTVTIHFKIMVVGPNMYLNIYQVIMGKKMISYIEGIL